MIVRLFACVGSIGSGSSYRHSFSPIVPCIAILWGASLLPQLTEQVLKWRLFPLERSNALAQKKLTIERQAPWFTGRIADSIAPAPQAAMPLPLLIVATGLTDGVSHSAPNQGRGAYQVRHSIACPQCRISFTKHVSFGLPADSVSVSADPDNVAVDSKGRIFAAVDRGTRVAMYDAGGKLSRVIGRRGAGPGEFRATIDRILVGANDSLFVFCRNFMSVFSRELVFARGATLASPGVRTILRDGSIVTRASIRTPDRVGHPYHILSRDGQVGASFGYDGRPITAGPAALAAEPMVDRDGFSVWTGSNENKYRLVKWTRRGTAVDSLEFVDVPWLAEPLPRIDMPASRGAWRTGDSVLPSRNNAPRLRPSPHYPIDVAGVDAAGQIWVLIGKPVGYDTTANGPALEWRLEGVDPVSRRVAFSQPLPITRGLLLPGTNFFLTNALNETGGVTYTLYRVNVTR